MYSEVPCSFWYIKLYFCPCSSTLLVCFTHLLEACLLVVSAWHEHIEALLAIRLIWWINVVNPETDGLCFTRKHWWDEPVAWRGKFLVCTYLINSYKWLGTRVWVEALTSLKDVSRLPVHECKLLTLVVISAILSKWGSESMVFINGCPVTEWCAPRFIALKVVSYLFSLWIRSVPL